jgi:hypothetical protein
MVLRRFKWSTVLQELLDSFTLPTTLVNFNVTSTTTITTPTSIGTNSTWTLPLKPTSTTSNTSVIGIGVLLGLTTIIGALVAFWLGQKRGARNAKLALRESEDAGALSTGEFLGGTTANQEGYRGLPMLPYNNRIEGIHEFPPKGIQEVAAQVELAELGQQQ